jgi:hypothetical protein
MARNWVKDSLESSPWALGAVVAAAVLAFLFTMLELGWRLFDRAGASPHAPTMEIAGLGRLRLVPVTPAMQEVELVRSALEISGFAGGSDGKRVPLWPVQLRVLNPTRDAINLHGCSMRVILPLDAYKGVKLLGPLESSEYFLSDAIASVEARAAGKPITIDPGEAKRMQLYFLFAVLTQTRQPGKTGSSPAVFSDPAIAEVACRDEAGRELVAKSTVYGDLAVENRAAPASKKKAKP